MHLPMRPRLLVGLCLVAVFILSLLSLRTDFHRAAFGAVKDVAHNIHDKIAPPPPPPPPPEPTPEPYKPTYKHVKPESSYRIEDNFQIGLMAKSAADIPPIPAWNKPPSPHVPEHTPLFIGFTRNWRLLQQVVISYITAGWPPEDIYIVENTGVMKSNAHGLLSLQNPFFLNYTRLEILGVNVMNTPTLLSFAQLQNFFTYTALEKGWKAYWWSHMDAIVVSNEEAVPYASLYTKAIEVLREVSAPDFARHPETNEPGRWGLVFHSYDQLALVNTEAYVAIGGWDTQIPYYMTDCDFHARLRMEGWQTVDRNLGGIWDVAGTFQDLAPLYRKKSLPQPSFLDPETGLRVPEEDSEHMRRKNPDWIEDTINSPQYQQLKTVAEAIQKSKHSNPRGRNTWQGRQMGGQGEPFFRDPIGFEQAINMAIQHGREVFSEKWGHRDCDILELGLKTSDIWQVEHDWEPHPAVK